VARVDRYVGQRRGRRAGGGQREGGGEQGDERGAAADGVLS
jgi:hypothetical protein